MKIFILILQILCLLSSLNSTDISIIDKPLNYLTDNEAMAIQYNPLDPETLLFAYKLQYQSSSVHISFFIQNHSFYDDDKILIAYNIQEYFANYFPETPSNIKHNKSFEIDKNKLETFPCFKYPKGCWLFLTVFFKKEPSYQGLMHPSFIIQITRNIISLNFQKKYNGSLTRNQIKYFQLDIENDKKENTIIFFLETDTKNDSDIDLFINRGIDNNWPDPIYKHYSWRTNKSSEKNYFSITQKKDKINNRNNSYVIAVYGKTDIILN